MVVTTLHPASAAKYTEGAPLSDTRPSELEPAQCAPRTLIVSWHWPPTNRASAGGLGHLFGTAPPGVFRVLTRSFPEDLIADRRIPTDDLNERVPPTFVPWPGDDQTQPTLRSWPALLRTLARFARRADQIHRAWPVERVLAVYPHRFSLLAGWRIARRLGVPLVLYMRDLCAESLTFRNPIRRRFWKAVDAACLRDAWMVIVPTAEFAAHYRDRGITRCWVLPHSLPESYASTEAPPHHDTLHLIYSGALYDAHTDAARCFISATRSLDDVRVTYLTDPKACNGLLDGLAAKWVPHRELMNTLQQADAFVVFLSAQTPFPEEIQGCFPSKLIDYLSVGRPILAIVPPGCFVDRLITETGCGVVVRDHDPASVRAGIVRLRDPHRRAEMHRQAARLVGQLRSELWMARVLERLRVGPRAAASMEQD
ncbi:MAG: hypothetical protein IID43_07365 [Planctomycetes bacterium]|nr:hypothetical protein [Planctomycetota bacterium]